MDSCPKSALRKVLSASTSYIVYGMPHQSGYRWPLAQESLEKDPEALIDSSDNVTFTFDVAGDESEPCT
eukprot:3136389-Amphidinium_carterae.1